MAVALTSTERSRLHYQRNREECAAKRAAWRRDNPEKEAENKRRSYLKNQENNKAYAAAWRLANPEKVKAWAANVPKEVLRARVREWKARNVEYCRKYGREYMQTPHGKLNNRIRARLNECLRKGYNTKKSALLGWTIPELRAHLERQFVGEMSWKNMGEWHIDHIIPLSSFTFDGTDDPEFRRAWALTNLRPLWAQDNMQKSDKILTLL